MTTKLINIGEYRTNIGTLWKKAQKENIRYLVLVNGKPAFEVNPVSKDYLDDSWDIIYTEENHKAWLEARKDLEAGETIKLDLDKIKTEDDFISFLKQ